MASGSNQGRRVRIDVVADRDLERERRELRRLLTASPRRIPSRYFYDAAGSRLFEEITRLPEYYLTRAETAILERHAPDIVARTGTTELIELGSGSSSKTRILLDAMQRAGRLGVYVPFDVSEPAVRAAADALAERYPELEIHGLVGEFDRDPARLPAGGGRLVLLIGSTIGNFDDAQAAELLDLIAAPLAAGDYFLLGADLVKDVRTLEAAYNDSLGITARFNLNILRALNAAFGGDFEPAHFEHRAFFNREHERIEMWLVAQRRQRVRLGRLDLEIEIADGEEILTEISCKYRRSRVERLLARGGFAPTDWWTDRDRRFALALARRLG